MSGSLSDLLEVSLTMGAVIALLLALTPALARRFSPRWRYWAWLFIALRLCLPFNIDLPAAPVQVEAPAALTAPKYDPDMTAEVEAARPYGWQQTSMGRATYEVWYHDDQSNVFHIYDNPIFRLEGVNGDWDLSIHWMGLWALGAGISLFHLVWSYGRMCRDLKQRRLAPSEAELRELEKQRRLLMVLPDVELCRVPGLGSPMLVGLLRPAVLLPENLPEEVLPVTLAHELTHLKRHDLWYKLLLALARCLHWFNPLVWLMCGRAGRDVELCCDYDLLHSRDEEERRAYGQAILDQMTAGAPRNSRLTTGFSGDKREVFARFRAIMDTSAKKKGRAALALTLAAVLLGGGLVACRTGGATSSGTGQPTEGGDVTAWLKYSPDLAISVGCYEDGFDWDYDALSALSTFSDSCTVVIQLPEGVTGTVRAARDFYHRIPLDDGFGGIYEKDTYELTPDDQDQVSLYLERDPRGGNQRATYYLTWGDNARFRYVFRVNLWDPAEEIDFAGFTGTAYARTLQYLPGGRELGFALSLGESDAMYSVPLAEGAELPQQLTAALSPTGQYTVVPPDCYAVDLAGGAVVGVERILAEANTTVSQGYAIADLELGPDGTMLVFGTVDKELSQVQFEPVDWFDEGDERARKDWWKARWETGDGETLTAELARGAEAVYRTNGRTYPLDPGIIEFGIWQTQDGKVMLELTFDDAGRVSRLVMRGGASGYLSGSGLDFTGYTGTVYAKRANTAQVTDLKTLEYAEDGIKILYFDPCEASGWDRDDTSYALPLAEKADIPDELRFFLKGLSSGRYPTLYEITLADGQVTAIKGRWQDRTGEYSSVPYMDLSDYSGTLYARGTGELSYFAGDAFLTLSGVQLPLAGEVDLPRELLPFLSGLSSAIYPDYYELTLEYGAVTKVRGNWQSEGTREDLAPALPDESF